MQIIDADGHINDHACGDEIATYMPVGNQMARVFPELDHLHFRYLKQNRRNTGNPTAEDWTNFLDKTGISWTVLYPTAGLAVGRIMAEEWASVACKAYNTWLYERFLNKSPRLKGVALIPFQNVDCRYCRAAPRRQRTRDARRHAAVERRSHSRTPRKKDLLAPL